MLSNREPAGSCPECTTPIPEGAVLIEYETAHGRLRYASCPDCRDVVHPQ